MYTSLASSGVWLIAKKCGASINHNAGAPPIFIFGHTKEAGYVVASGVTNILGVDSAINVAQVVYPVIGLAPINMVNLAFRPRPIE